MSYDLDGTMRLGVGSGAFSGKVRFLGATMSCSGEVSPQKLTVSGSIKHNWSQSGWGIKVTLKPEVTLTPSSAAVHVTASGKACAMGACTGVKIKDVGSNVSIGHFRVCVGVDSQILGMPDISEGPHGASGLGGRAGGRGSSRPQTESPVTRSHRACFLWPHSRKSGSREICH